MVLENSRGFQAQKNVTNNWDNVFQLGHFQRLDNDSLYIQIAFDYRNIGPNGNHSEKHSYIVRNIVLFACYGSCLYKEVLNDSVEKLRNESGKTKVKLVVSQLQKKFLN